VLACAAGARAQTTLVADSPFAPSGAAAGGARGAPEAYELAGSTVQGSQVTVCIYQARTKRSQWINVGGVSDGIKVISFDPVHDTAVVLVAGNTKQLALRKPTASSKGPAAAPQPIAMEATPQAVIPNSPPPTVAAEPSTPEAALREQREARMLVSDLLDIGVQQRKAYQEARQRAAAGTPPPDN
jgi:hypothetical protein